MICKLHDLITIKHGFAFSGDHIKTDDNGVVLVTPGNFRIGGGFKEDKCKFFDGEFPDEYVLHPGDLIVTMTDLSKSIDTLGFSALVPKTQRVYLHNQRIGLVNFISADIDKSFLYWFMRTPKYQKTIAATSTGSTVHHTSPDRIRDVVIDLPNLETQKKISSFLSAIESKIELNNRINVNLEQQAMELFKVSFVGNPSAGETIPLYEFANYINGAAFKSFEYSNDGLPIIKIAELKNGITDSTQHFNGSKDDKYIIQNKDILFSWSGNHDTSIDIFIWCGGKAILNQHTFNVKSKENTPWFMFLLLKYFKPQFAQIASNKQTTGLGHVTVADLKRLTFPHNTENNKAFEEMIAPFMEMIYNNTIENSKLVMLRDTLLPRLMSGELDVSEVKL